MNKSIQVVVIMLTFALFIGACQPVAASAQQGPQAQATQGLDTQSQINTAVAQTIEAQNQIGTAVALTTEAQFTATPAATLVTIPTLPPFVVSTPTNTPGRTATVEPKYSCDIIRLRPLAYTEINRGQEFDIKMTVVNNGTRGWYEGFDLKYSGGAQMTSVTRVQLPAMAPGDQYEVVLDAVAPMERGNQTMTWRVDGPSCFGYVVITVK
jgi:hypothetical protein